MKAVPLQGTRRGSTSQYRQNFSQQTWTFAPITMLGLWAAFPACSMRLRQRHLRAMPASIDASLDPVVDVPVAPPCSSVFHNPLIMFTQRRSSSAVRGYSSLSIMFLSNVFAISSFASGSIHVVT
jgi:hypothetical protein